MPAGDPAPSVADAEAEVAKAEADLAAAEAGVTPEVAPVPAEPTTEELLANAPPLILPAGQHILKQCVKCGLRLQDPPPDLVCPNCGNIVP